MGVSGCLSVEVDGWLHGFDELVLVEGFGVCVCKCVCTFVWMDVLCVGVYVCVFVCLQGRGFTFFLLLKNTST